MARIAIAAMRMKNCLRLETIRESYARLRGYDPLIATASFGSSDDRIHRSRKTPASWAELQCSRPAQALAGGAFRMITPSAMFSAKRPRAMVEAVCENGFA